MASAGHAQAHSSQPMHFSRPSAYRLSWWRPWYRGLGGTFSNGYCSVTVGLNIDANVTPNPATGASSSPSPDFGSMSGWYAPGSPDAGRSTSPPRRVTPCGPVGSGSRGSATRHLRLVVDRVLVGRRVARRAGGGCHPGAAARRGRQLLPGERRDGVPARERVELPGGRGGL